MSSCCPLCAFRIGKPEEWRLNDLESLAAQAHFADGKIKTLKGLVTDRDRLFIFVVFRMNSEPFLCGLGRRSTTELAPQPLTGRFEAGSLPHT